MINSLSSVKKCGTAPQAPQTRGPSRAGHGQGVVQGRIKNKVVYVSDKQTVFHKQMRTTMDTCHVVQSLAYCWLTELLPLQKRELDDPDVSSALAGGLAGGW